jgi:hypothetical protein
VPRFASLIPNRTENCISELGLQILPGGQYHLLNQAVP